MKCDKVPIYYGVKLNRLLRFCHHVVILQKKLHLRVLIAEATCRFKLGCWCSSSLSLLVRHSLRLSHKQEWGRGFILLQPEAAVLPGSDAGSDGAESALGFVIKNCQTSCSMWCPMHGDTLLEPGMRFVQ